MAVNAGPTGGRSLRSGTSTVGVGLLLFGAASYAFLAVAARSCGPSRFATLSLLWITTTTLGAGLFLPLEQELARAAEGAGRYRSVRCGGRTAAPFGFALALSTVVSVVVADRPPARCCTNVGRRPLALRSAAIWPG